MSDDEEKPTVTLHRVIGEDAHRWHDGAGWYYVDDEYPDEGSVGAFDTEASARAHAADAGYAVSEVRQ